MSLRISWMATAVAALVCVALSAQEARAQETPKGLTAHDVARLRSVRETAISPDGALIAYTLSIPRDLDTEDDGGAWSELHVVDAGGASRGFVTGKVNVGGIQWVDAGRISFTTKRGADTHQSLYVIDVTGGEARRVLAFDDGVGAYSWGPDGKTVAFLSAGAEDKQVQKRKKRGFDAEIYEEDRRPTRLWLVDVTEVDAKPRAVDLPGVPSDPLFSPDGAHLALTLQPSPLIDDAYMRRRLTVVETRSGTVTASVETEGKLGGHVWSPDGKHIALIAARDIHDPAPGRLMIVESATGTSTELVASDDRHVRSAAWTDATTVLFLWDRGVKTHISELSIGPDRIERAGAIEGVAVTSLSVSRDGDVLALRGASREHPDEVFRATRDGLVGVRLTNSNEWLATRRLATQEVVEFEARDGLKLQGILIRPLDEKPGTRYPLVMVVHGGPESHQRDGWMTWYASGGQALAARGFAVFYPNYRASTGRGVEFSMLDHGDMGGREFDDLVDGVKHLVATGLVDEKKVGVTGGSYGGYASAWCATALSEHFAAAVMSVGISDQISFAGTTDIPDEMNLVHYRVRPWEDWKLFLERSPIYHAEKGRTPILIMHGKNDTRVHPSQSLELYRYLKVLGKTPVRLVLYPGEGHGNRRAASRLDYSLRLMRWMEHYLVGEGGEPPPREIDHGVKER